MKKIVTIMMLVVAILGGGMTIEAKTTKKKAKARTTQTSSTQWNGDIPSASVLFSFLWQNRNKYGSFIEHGYSYIGDDMEGRLVKTGVCSIEWGICGSGACSKLIYVYDSSKRQWLYNNLKKYIASKKLKNFYVYLFDNCIQLEEVYR